MLCCCATLGTHVPEAVAGDSAPGRKTAEKPNDDANVNPAGAGAYSMAGGLVVLNHITALLEACQKSAWRMLVDGGSLPVNACLHHALVA